MVSIPAHVDGCFCTGPAWAVTQRQQLFCSLCHRVQMQAAVTHTAIKGRQLGDVLVKN